MALGGIEASLRRISHYDYWKDELRKCILCDSGADLILYGMGERSIVELANAFAEGKTMDQIHEMPQVAFYCKEKDSMVNRYTANRRMRSEDAFSPDSRHDMRPDYPSIVYTQILKKLYPDVPVALGGIEASLRRISHYDYWKDELRKLSLIHI